MLAVARKQKRQFAIRAAAELEIDKQQATKATAGLRRANHKIKRVQKRKRESEVQAKRELKELQDTTSRTEHTLRKRLKRKEEQVQKLQGKVKAMLQPGRPFQMLSSRRCRSRIFWTLTSKRHVRGLGKADFGCL